MNEVMARRYIKNLMRKGIQKNIAEEIVITSMTISKGKNLDLAINYATDLIYGFGFSRMTK